MSRLFLYLARRDKKGLKLVSVFQGEHTYPIRLQDVPLLNLPNQKESEIKRIIPTNNRMYWEPLTRKRRVLRVA